jgi:acyl dehydratase
MELKTFEDFPVGTELRFGSYNVTRDEIIAFAREFDPQAFHLDEEAAKASLLQGLAASGWHTCAMTMRMICDGYLNQSTGLGSPGIDEIRWLRPVRPGMRLSVVQKVVSTRVSRSRPEIGFVGVESETLDETGQSVMSQRYTAMFGRLSRDLPPDAGTPMPTRRPEPDPQPVEPALNETRFSCFYEDVVVGARMELGDYLFDRDTVIRFASAYDPQPFHLSDEGAAGTHFGRLAASGWHTSAAYMSCYIATRNRVRAAAAARGETVVPTGPSPGIRDLHWWRPVYAGDRISYSSVVVGKRPHLRPGWGIMTSRSIGTNQDGVRVYEASGAMLLPMREGSSVPVE